MSSKVGYVVSCVSCHKVMGELGTEEYFSFVADEDDPGLCFECDPDSAGLTPSVFWQWEENELIDIGDVGFQVRDNSLRVIGASRARVHERTHARGLSSYTYLNRTIKNRLILANGLEITICPSCQGKGILSEFGEAFACASCGGIGSLPCAILIPSWLIQGGENNV